MEFGGSDITRCFFNVIQRSGINLRELDPQSTVDCLLLQEMKETYCNLDQVMVVRRVFILNMAQF